MTKHYVKFFYPGSFVSETTSSKIDDRSKRPEVPSRAYGWQFFDREEIVENGETLHGAAKNYSPVHYIGDEISEQKALDALKRSNGILRANIEGNGYTRLVRTRFGQIFPLDANDIVVAPEKA